MVEMVVGCGCDEYGRIHLYYHILYSLLIVTVWSHIIINQST